MKAFLKRWRATTGLALTIAVTAILMGVLTALQRSGHSLLWILVPVLLLIVWAAWRIDRIFQEFDRKWRDIDRKWGDHK